MSQSIYANKRRGKKYMIELPFNGAEIKATTRRQNTWLEVPE